MLIWIYLNNDNKRNELNRQFKKPKLFGGFQQNFEKKQRFDNRNRRYIGNYNQEDKKSFLKQDHEFKKDIICYKCGKSGHKAHSCNASSEDIKAYKSRTRISLNNVPIKKSDDISIVEATIGKKTMKIMIDSGAILASYYGGNHLAELVAEGSILKRSDQKEVQTVNGKMAKVIGEITIPSIMMYNLQFKNIIFKVLEGQVQYPIFGTDVLNAIGVNLKEIIKSMPQQIIHMENEARNYAEGDTLMMLDSHDDIKIYNKYNNIKDEEVNEEVNEVIEEIEDIGISLYTDGLKEIPRIEILFPDFKK